MKAFVVSRFGRSRNCRCVHRRVTMYTRPGTIRRGIDIPFLRQVGSDGAGHQPGLVLDLYLSLRRRHEAAADGELEAVPGTVPPARTVRSRMGLLATARAAHKLPALGRYRP